MKRLILLCFILLEVVSVSAQDIGVTAITSPVSGCNLSATSTVTVRIFNYGPNVVTPFNVSYTVNGGAPVTEVINTVILSNSTYTYSFTTPVNLSTAGVYTFTAYTTMAGDINPTNDAVTGYQVTSDAPSAGGTVSGGTSVCNGSNSGSLNVAGFTGTIQRWEYSTDNGNTWINISNTSTTQSYLNLTTKTFYRVVTTSGSCPASTSSIDSITIDQPTIAGSVSGTASVCSGSNGGTMTLSGHTGSVLNWEFSVNNGVTWTPIANITTSQTYSNLTVNTRYRAVVQNGACPSANSSAAILTVSPPTVAGTVSGSDTVCSGSNSGAMILSGNTGAITRWEFSVNNGVSWTNITNTTTTQTYTNLTVSRLYRALVRSGGCPSRYSDTASIVVDPQTIPGTLSGGTTVCAGNNTGTLTLSGSVGTVQNWESSTDGGSTWLMVSNTTPTHTYTNLTASTVFRALVKSGSCNAGYSTTTTVTVDSASAAGTVASSATVCSGSNGATLVLGTSTGNIQGWISSTDAGATWTTIPNTTNAQAYSNLTTSTIYAAIVKNGVCPNDTSAFASITVDPVTVGGTVAGSATVCGNVNSGTLTLSGETGSILNWESSTDGGFTWVPISNTTNTQAYNNVSVTTKYRAQIQSGVCAPAFSSAATITVDAASVGGTVFGGTTVCAAGNSGTLSLIGYSGTIAFWESSSDNGVNWSPTGSATPTLNYNNLNTTTLFRAVVISGVCPSDTSSIGTMTVDSVSIGGAVASNDTVCFGANSGTVSLTGFRGTVTGWEVSTDNGNTWFTISNTTTSQNFFNLTTTTSYRANIKNGVCPAASATPATITVQQNSSAGSIAGVTQGCSGTVSGTLTSSGNIGSITDWVTSTDNGATWTGTGEDSTAFVYTNLTTTTLFSVVVQNGACGSDTSASVTVSVFPKPVAAIAADTVCKGAATSFSNTSTISSGFIQMYQWDLGDNSASVAPTPIHTYQTAGTFTASAIAISDKGCADTASTVVLVNALPVASISLSQSSPFCEGTTIDLSGPAGPYAYDWSTNDSTMVISASVTGTYILTITDTVTSCMATDSVSIEAVPRPIANAGRDTSVSVGGSVVLVGTGGPSYSWSPIETLTEANISNPMATPMQTTTYTLVVTNDIGCSDTDEVVVTVNLDYNFTPANLITPNGDGFNDTWIIENIDLYSDSKVSVFNRNGQLIFSADAYKNDWGATYNGERIPDGSYYYVISFGGSQKLFKGSLTVLTEETK